MEKLDIVDKSENSIIINKQCNSLKNLKNYESSDSSSEDSEDDSEENSTSSDSDTSESDSDTSVSSGDSNCDSNVEEVAALNRKNDFNTNRAATATDIFDAIDFSLLPDLEKLDINYEKEEFLQMGHVKAIILDTVVTVEALPGIPAYNLDTILFMKNPNDQQQHPLGVVEDVIGPVESPLYCLRFQTAEALTEKGVTVGMEVFAAPKNDCTKYVFIKELMKIKGSDASWIGDKELPPELAKESDEESECDADEARKAPKRKLPHQQNPTKLNTHDSNSRFYGRSRRGCQRAPGHFPVPFHSHQNMHPNYQEHGPVPNYKYVRYCIPFTIHFPTEYTDVFHLGVIFFINHIKKYTGYLLDILNNSLTIFEACYDRNVNVLSFL
nr:unnamed protein product [Callosobruchus chinensis]